MKITIKVSLDVDPVLWDLAYGTGTAQTDVREDVRSSVLTTLQGHAAVEEGGIRSVELR